jgi:lysozyme family protein/peptidoglycan hydrolase-like protein with peptidoglycan-binding domain
MAVQFANVRAEYDHLAEIAAATTPAMAAHFHNAAHRILQYRNRYFDAAERSGIPALWYMVINERESGSDFNTYLGNGDQFKHVTSHVPKGRGPFKSWEDGAIDATTYDHVGRPGPEGWSWAWFLYRCEAWNGFGPRLHGHWTGYLWAGTQVYDADMVHGGGKYVADGVWDSSAHDTQLGVYGLARALIALDPTLMLSPPLPLSKNWGEISATMPDDHFAPVKDDMKLTGIRWIQDSLNKIQGAGLLVDGSYGRHTRAAVRQFQSTHALWVDGQAGNLTCSAIDAALTEMQKSIAHPKADIIEATRPFRPENIAAQPAALQQPSVKGPRMDFTNLINLAGMVAPQFAPALVSSNPLLPVAINVLGDALGLNGPHSADTVSAGASGAPADVLASALKKAASDYAKHVTGAATSVGVTVGDQQPIPVAPAPAAPVAAPVADAAPAPKQTGGAYVSTGITNGLHLFTWIGGFLLSSGLLDPTGPLAGMAKGYPLLGVLLTVGGPILNQLIVGASNKATEQALSK